jgi:hypothetical protein
MSKKTQVYATYDSELRFQGHETTQKSSLFPPCGPTYNDLATGSNYVRGRDLHVKSSNFNHTTTY